MENIEKVYLVTKGRYSDYSVYGVFTDKAVAEEYAAQISDQWDTASVDPRPILNSSYLIVPTGFRGYCVRMDRDGNTAGVEREHSTTDEDDNRGYPEVDGKFVDGKCVYVYNGKYNFYILTDRGEEGAIKIANERRIRMIAENKWPEEGTEEKTYESGLD